MTRQYDNYGRDQYNVEYVQGNVTFNQTQIIQIAIAEIKTRPLNTTSPYRGLKPFAQTDKDYFFGRDQFLTGLVNELEQTNVILLLGASGSGKSSVVRAGLLPWLMQKWGSRLIDLTLTPDYDPFEALYGSLLKHYKQSEAQRVRDGNADTLSQMVQTLKQPESFWLIFIDQFEELFTTSQFEKRDRFIQSLVQLIQERPNDQLLKIVATMRADFLDRLDLAPANRLARITEKHRPLITQMHPDELRLAIEQPAAHHGVVFETGLVEEIIKDVQGQAGCLPLLQYTLNLLWETEVQTGSIHDRTLNISNYRNLGGVRGALQKHVEEVYQVLSEPERLVAQRIFLKLIEIGGNVESGAEWRPVRRRAGRSEFGDPLEQKILIRLINENLLVSSRETQSLESTVEIAHEILLTSWSTLSTWIRENRRDIALRNRLNDDVSRWEVRKQNDELWEGSKLERVLELRKDYTFTQVLGGFSPIANQFIDASVGRRDRQRQRIIIGLTGFSAVTLTMALIAFQQYLEATRQKTSAELKAITTNSELLASQGNQFDALIEALRASEKLKKESLIQESDVAYRVKATLMKAVYNIREYNRLEEHLGSVNSVIFSKDGQLIVSASDDNTIKLWSPTGELLRTLTHEEDVNSISISQDGQIIASAGTEVVKLWSKNGDPITTLAKSSEHFYSVNFSPDSKKIAVGSDNGTVKIWKHTSSPYSWKPSKPLSVYLNQVEVKAIKFSPKGNMIASAYTDGVVRLWNSEGKLLRLLKGHRGSVNSVSFSTDGEILASGGEDRIINLWNVKTGQKLRTLSGHQDSVNSVSFNRDGMLASASSDKTVKLWQRDGSLFATLIGHSDKVNEVEFAPNDQIVASASTDNSIRLWRISSKEESQKFTKLLDGKTLNKEEISISVARALLASTQTNYGDIPPKLNNSVIRLWNLNDKNNAKPKVLKEQNSLIDYISFSPDGRKIIAVIEPLSHHSYNNRNLIASNDKGLILTWDLDEGSTPQRVFLDIPAAEIRSLSFSTDGKTVAFACRDGSIKLWNFQSNQFKTLNTRIANTTNESLVSNRIEIALSDNIIALSNRDYTISLWDENGTLLHSLKGHGDQINSINFNSDGRLIVSGSNDGSIIIWDYKGTLVKTLKGHNGAINWVTFSPDNRIIASGGKDGTVRLWSPSGDLLQTLQPQKQRAEVLRVEFNHDGSELISIDANNLVVRWNLNQEDLREQCCELLKNYFIHSSKVGVNEKKLCLNFNEKPAGTSKNISPW